MLLSFGDVLNYREKFIQGNLFNPIVSRSSAEEHQRVIHSTGRVGKRISGASLPKLKFFQVGHHDRLLLRYSETRTSLSGATTQKYTSDTKEQFRVETGSAKLGSTLEFVHKHSGVSAVTFSINVAVDNRDPTSRSRSFKSHRNTQPGYAESDAFLSRGSISNIKSGNSELHWSFWGNGAGEPTITGHREL